MRDYLRERVQDIPRPSKQEGFTLSAMQSARTLPLATRQCMISGKCVYAQESKVESVAAEIMEYLDKEKVRLDSF